MHGITLGVRFVWELAMLGALAAWGFQATSSTPVNVLVGIAAPIAAATAWGLFLAPRRRFDMPVVVRVAVEMALFAVATLALLTMGRPVLAIIFGAVAITQRAVLSAMGDNSARVT